MVQAKQITNVVHSKAGELAKGESLVKGKGCLRLSVEELYCLNQSNLTGKKRSRKGLHGGNQAKIIPN